MSHRRMGFLVYVLASAPVTFIAAIVFYAWTFLELRKGMSK